MLAFVTIMGHIIQAINVKCAIILVEIASGIGQMWLSTLIPEINVPKVMPAQAYAQKHIPRGYVITEPVKQE